MLDTYEAFVDWYDADTLADVIQDEAVVYKAHAIVTNRYNRNVQAKAGKGKGKPFKGKRKGSSMRRRGFSRKGKGEGKGGPRLTLEQRKQAPARLKAKTKCKVCGELGTGLVTEFEKQLQDANSRISIRVS